ncbi:glycosyltransferase [Enterococcus gallinarum]|uniref:glycosyltransferase n=1 Tax=Enterococcus gallinarum TaxID=1353 RepID=UPI0035CB2B1D|nr:glycosyltransferase [Enterococcus gallinarum]
MKRVLHILNGLGTGGAESFIMNVYRNIDRNEFQFDFLIRSNEGNILVDEITQLGGKVIIAPNFPRNVFKNKKFMKKFFDEEIEKYNFVHIHANSLVYYLPINLLLKKKFKNIILHSHNTQPEKKYMNFIHFINRHRLNNKTVRRIACSQSAGEWLYNGEFTVIHNSIDTEKFSFKKDQRILIREKYNIKDEFIIGNVGRFINQKNHKFILEVYSEFYKIYPNSKLLLVGEGILMEEVKLLARKMGIHKNIVFTGAVSNIAEYYSAMDCFLLPSFYEGLPIALVEAQTSGLNCFVSSESVSGEADLTKLIEFISLKESPSKWAKEIFSNMYADINRDAYEMLVRENGFGVEQLTNNLITNVYV